MTSPIIDLVKAVADALEAGTFSQSLSVVSRRYVPNGELTALSTLTVQVVPRGITREAVDRGGTERLAMRVDVAIQRTVPAGGGDEDDPDGADALMALVEEIHQYLKTADLNLPYTWTGCENEPPYAVEHLEQMNLFTSVLTCTWEGGG